MYKRMKILTAGLITGLSLMVVTPVSAAGTPEQMQQGGIQLMSVNTLTSTATLSIARGNATCTARIMSQESNALKITMYLQKNVSGTWKTIRTWSGSKTGTIYSLKKTAAVSKGKYRVKAVMKSGTESVTKYSSTVTY